MSTQAYYSPNGDLIVGTMERIYATARITGTDAETGMPNYEGGSDIGWDSQVTQIRDGKIVFVCETGEQWTFDQLVACVPTLKL